MTCIIGYTDNKYMYIAGDSAGTTSSSLEIRGDKKVFKLNNMLIGFTSSFRMGQILKYSFTPPKIQQSIEKYMSSIFIDAVRKCLSIKGYARDINGEELGGDFLVLVKGKIFNIANDYQVGWLHNTPYNSIGSGSDLALGSLFSTANNSISTKKKIITALTASEQYNPTVRKPFNIIKLKI